MDVEQMFGGKIDMFPEQKSFQMKADVLTEKTNALDWECKKSSENHIDTLRKNESLKP